MYACMRVFIFLMRESATIATTANIQLKVLRGFRKVSTNPGETRLVTISLTQQDFTIWDVTKHDWALVTGEFSFLIGSSSRDIRLKASYTI